jgi:glycerophosphoryl diester phosphodiesterase
MYSSIKRAKGFSTKATLLSLLLSALGIPFSFSQVDIQGHRGCRGLMPENSIAAMQYAISIGVTTLEMDVVATGDSQIVVSHEPWISDKICLIDTSFQEKRNLFELSYDEIKYIDCGSKNHPDFPLQYKLVSSKPLLSELLDSTEALAKEKGIQLTYNIEIKSRKSWDGIYQPSPEILLDWVMQSLNNKDLIQHCIIQSFDTRILELLHLNYPEVKVSYLTEKGRLLQRNLNQLSFTPHYYSPYHKLLSKQSIRKCHEKGIMVAPWTVNKTKRAKKLIKWGVDAIITDYPNLMLAL